jgi:hypothetical protein
MEHTSGSLGQLTTVELKMIGFPSSREHRTLETPVEPRTNGTAQVNDHAHA